MVYLGIYTGMYTHHGYPGIYTGWYIPLSSHNPGGIYLSSSHTRVGILPLLLVTRVGIPLSSSLPGVINLNLSYPGVINLNLSYPGGIYLSPLMYPGGIYLSLLMYRVYNSG